MIHAFFDGVTATTDSDAVRALLDSVIADLVAKDEANTEAIMTVLKVEHGLDVTESCVADYFHSYAEKHLPDLYD
jgi:hypothetical protein